MSPRPRAATVLADDLAAIFAAELEEQLRAAARILPGASAPGDESTRRDLTRIFHTIKGGAGLAGRSDLAAAAESLERSFRDPAGNGPPAAAALEQLFAAAGLVLPDAMRPAALRGIVLAIGGQRFALPLHCVERAAVIETRAIAALGPRAVVGIAGFTYPLVPLHAWLGEPLPPRRAAALLLRSGAGETVVLAADRVAAPCALRLTALGPGFADHPLLREATIDPSGRPCPVLDAARLAALAGAPAPETTPPPRSGQAVLVVDDSRTVRNAIGEILSAAGIDFDTAVDGRDALVKLGRSRFSVVLTDLEMPNIDGVELLEILRRDDRWHSQPVVVCSSRSGDDGGRLGRLGIAGFLSKPFSAAALLERVQPFVSPER